MKLKKLLILIVAILLSVGGWADNTDEGLVGVWVEKTNGEAWGYAFSKKPVIAYEGNLMILTWEEGVARFAMEDVRRLYFADVPLFNPADVNRDGVVDSADIVAVIKEMPDGDMKANVNGDTVIDSADIVAVIKAMK